MCCIAFKTMFIGTPKSIMLLQGLFFFSKIPLFGYFFLHHIKQYAFVATIFSLFAY